DLTALAPHTARVERFDGVQEIPISEVGVGEVVVVRPGEKIPVDGEVIGGNATVNQATITGESMPVEVAPGSYVYATTLAQLGSLRIKVARVGADTTFGRVVKMVEEAETHRSEVQRLADRFSAWYLPIVLGVAVVTYAVTRDPLSTAAVLLVACSCSIALATPIAMLASVGASAKRGLLIKGGKYLESLARADVLLIDKTGTLTVGKPAITDVVPLNGLNRAELLQLTASAEQDSEHPLAQAVSNAAAAQGLTRVRVQAFEALPGLGVRAQVNGFTVSVGNRRMIPSAASVPVAAELERQGKTLLFVARDDALVGVLAATDTLRPEVPEALQLLRAMGIRQMELLTGDNEQTAA
ncbi:TPA: heavy metal translocating P-type ATPase, partial [Vibrio cholerae O1]